MPVKLACNPGKHDQSTGSGKNDGGKQIDEQGGGNSAGVPAYGEVEGIVPADLRRRRPDLPAIMVSGYVGMQQFDLDPPLPLNKPVRRATLNRRLRDLQGNTGPGQ